MKRILTTTGLAMACAVGLAATQATTGTSGTAQDPQTTTGQRGGGPRTITGCLRAGDTAGTYELTNIEGLGGGRRGGDATAGTATGTQQGRGPGGPMTLMLTPESSVDLKPHVGHKIEVTGTLAGGGRPGSASGTATGTATGTGTTTGTTTGGTTTGTGTATGTGTTGTGAQGQGRGMRSMTVTSIKMISESCS